MSSCPNCGEKVGSEIQETSKGNKVSTVFLFLSKLIFILTLGIVLLPFCGFFLLFSIFTINPILAFFTAIFIIFGIFPIILLGVVLSLIFYGVGIGLKR